jgi:hypothetical protein
MRKRDGMKIYDEMLRVSALGTRKEDDESTRTLDDQRRANRETAKLKGGRIGKTLKMVDESGFTILPKIQADVIARVRSGESNGIIIAYSDRLARNWWDAGAFFTAMAEAGAEIWDAQAPEVDYRSDDGRQLWGMKMVMNEIPSLAAKRRDNRLADELVAKGIATKVSYGYRRNADAAGVKTDPSREDLLLVLDDVFDKNGNIVGGTAQYARRIFDLRGDGWSWVRIADTLNDAGVPSPSGKRWGPSSIAAIVANEIYAGVVKLGDRRMENAHEPLISAAKWRKVQSTVKQTRTGRLVAGIAGGLLRCGTCGLPLSTAGTGRDGRVMYGCRRRSSGIKCPRPVYVTKSAADDFVESAIVTLVPRSSSSSRAVTPHETSASSRTTSTSALSEATAAILTQKSVADLRRRESVLAFSYTVVTSALPREVVDEEAAEQRPDHRRDAEDGAKEALIAATVPWRDDVPDNGDRDHEQAPAAETLNRPKDDQLGHVLGNPA